MFRLDFDFFLLGTAIACSYTPSSLFSHAVSGLNVCSPYGMELIAIRPSDMR